MASARHEMAISFAGGSPSMIYRAVRLGVAAFLLCGLAGWAGGAGGAASTLRSHARTSGLVKTVTYRGYHFAVPRSWPVISDTENPRGCVRFDQHALYLGPVSSDEFCPSWLLGTTESVLVQPGPAQAVPTMTEDTVARQISVRAPRIVITATFDTDPAVITALLASAGLPTTAAVPGTGPGTGSGSGSGSAAAVGAKPEAAGMHYPMGGPLL